MGVLALVLHDDGEMGDVDAEHGVGAVDAVDAEDVDVGGEILVVEGRVCAGGEGAVEGDVHAGVVEGAGGAVDEGVGAVEDGGVVGAVEVVGDAVGVAAGAEGEESEGTVVGAAGRVGAVLEPVGAVGAVGVEDVADVERVDTEFAECVEGGGTGAGLEAVHVWAEAVGGEDHVDDTAHLHSCQLSASSCSVSVESYNGLVRDDQILTEDHHRNILHY